MAARLSASSEDAGASLRSVEALALRLRSAVQGCTLHIHGPVQAVRAIDDADCAAEVRELLARQCRERVEELLAEGFDVDDLAIRKEMLTEWFVNRVLR